MKSVSNYSLHKEAVLIVLITVPYDDVNHSTYIALLTVMMTHERIMTYTLHARHYYS